MGMAMGAEGRAMTPIYSMLWSLLLFFGGYVWGMGGRKLSELVMLLGVNEMSYLLLQSYCRFDLLWNGEE